MVHVFPSATIPLSEFALAWRITDEHWDKIPTAKLKQIQPLAPNRAREVGKHRQAFRLRTVNTEFYHVAIDCSLEEKDESDGARIKCWFRSLPIVPVEQVSVSWSDDVALVTEWATFIEIWDSLWYPFDTLTIFDDFRTWAVLMGPEEHAVLVQSGSADPHAADYPYRAGYDLIRSQP
jgi:hypothetical protein